MATVAQRLAFQSLVENHSGAIARASAVAGDNAIMPETACFLLNLKAGSTYSQGAAYIAAQIAHGAHPLVG